MRLGWDTSILARTTEGMSRYTWEVLCRLAYAREVNHLMLISPMRSVWSLPISSKIRNVHVPCRIGFVTFRREWHECVLPTVASAAALDIVHFPANFNVPRRKVCKYVVTIHDVIPFILSELWDGRKAAKLQRAYRESAQRADLIITVSEVSRKDIISKLSISASKVVVIYQGISDSFKNVSRDHARGLVTSLQLPQQFFLHLSGHEKRKNAASVVRAFKSFLSRDNYTKRYFLIMTGRRDVLEESILASLDDATRRRIICLGVVSEEVLASLYSCATALVFPSLYEGFGLPPLESLACGTPVIVSDIPIFHELLGNEALYVDPTNEEMIAQAMHLCVEDGEIRRRACEKGRLAAHAFTWDATARKTVQQYNKILGRGSNQGNTS